MTTKCMLNLLCIELERPEIGATGQFHRCNFQKFDDIEDEHMIRKL